jgi:hypothetical protein
LPRLRKLLDHLHGHFTASELTPLVDLINGLASPP